MLQRFLTRTLKTWWLVPVGIACMLVGFVVDTSWWLIAVGAFWFLPLGWAVHLQGQERKLAEQRQREEAAKRAESPK